MEKIRRMMKKCLHKMKHTSNLHQWFLTLQKIQSYLNRRPISLSNNLEILCPEDINSLKSPFSPSPTLEHFVNQSDENVKLFCQKWKHLYFDFLYRQQKWFKSDSLAVGNLVVIMDTLNSFNFPSLGRIIKIDKDRCGIERYFHVLHKTRGSNQSRVLRRPAQALCLISEVDGDNRVEADFPDHSSDVELEDDGGEISGNGDQIVTPDDTQEEHLMPSDGIANNLEENVIDPPVNEEGDDLENIDLSIPEKDPVPVEDNIEIPAVRVLHPENIQSIIDIVPRKKIQKRKKKKQS